MTTRRPPCRSDVLFVALLFSLFEPSQERASLGEQASPTDPHRLRRPLRDGQPVNRLVSEYGRVSRMVNTPPNGAPSP